MPLFTYQSNTLEKLIEPFTQIISEPKESLLAKEPVLVQSIGMGRYFITQSARLTGVCANFEFIYPQMFFDRLLFHYGINSTASDKFAIAWMIFEYIRERPADLPGQLFLYSEGADELKLFKLALSIADTFDQYTMYRSDTILHWDNEDEVILQNGISNPLDPLFSWQYSLWHVLKKRGMIHRSAQLHQLKNNIADGNIPFERITALGLSNLPPFYLDLLFDLSKQIDVHLLLLNPSPGFWYDMISEQSFISKEIMQEYEKRSRGEQYYYMGNPLLSLYGTQGRDFHTFLLDAQAADSDYYEEVEERSLLSSIQADIYHLRDRGEFSDAVYEPFSFSKGDRSLMIHGCHNKMREIEILHDELLDAFESIEGLDPGDILVMTPDIAGYEPYIRAVFDTRLAGDAPLPYTIADLSVSNSNSMADALLKLLSLQNEPLTISLAVSLLECDELCRSFGIEPEERKECTDLLQNSYFRWGIDEQDRLEQCKISYDEFSLKQSLMRICSGIAYGVEDETFNDVVPAASIESGTLALSGSLMDFMLYLVECCRLFSGRMSLAKWGKTLASVVERLFEAGSADEQSVKELYDAIEKITHSGVEAEDLPFPLIRHLLTEQLSKEKKEFGFIDGRITFCEMLPMRSIPFKVLAITGMNENSFPRYTTPMSFDLIFQYKQRGDRSMQSDDRYLFLESLLSARERLLITYIAFKEEDNSERPPSVVVTELLDYISENCSNPKTTDEITVLHRLQPFTPMYYEGSKRYFSYASEYLAGAKALSQSRSYYQALGAPLTSAPSDDLLHIALSSLIYFFNNPYRYFLNRRMRISFPGETALPEDADPVIPDAFVRNNVMLDMLESGKETHSRIFRRYSYAFPPLAPGEYEFNKVAVQAGELKQKTGPYEINQEEALIRVSCRSHGLALSVEARLQLGEAEHQMLAPEWKSYDQMRAWLTHLLLQASGQSINTRVFTDEKMIVFKAIEKEAATSLFSDIIGLYASGLLSPLHFFKKSSFDAYRLYQKDSTMPLDAIAAKIRKKFSGPYGRLYELFNDYIAFCCDDPLMLVDESFVKNSLRFYHSFDGVVSNEKYQ